MRRFGESSPVVIGDRVLGDFVLAILLCVPLRFSVFSAKVREVNAYRRRYVCPSVHLHSSFPKLINRFQ
jgi:hypothetical protein